MKDVGDVNYWYIDHEVRKLREEKGVEILESSEAYKEYAWVRKYFHKKPKEGYFFWIKKSMKNPLISCISISSKNLEQNLQNLIVIEKGVRVKLRGTCNVLASNLCSKHIAGGTIVLRKNATVEYLHVHSWGSKDHVESQYEFLLEKNAKLKYLYNLSSSPKNMKMRTTIKCFDGANADVKISISSNNCSVNLQDEIELLGKGSSGMISIRVVARNNSSVRALSSVTAEEEGKGHLDCRGLLLDNSSSIELIPKLSDRNKKAILTHEASIGRISEEELNYLRARGISKKKAIELIISGFLKT